MVRIPIMMISELRVHVKGALAKHAYREERGCKPRLPEEGGGQPPRLPGR